MNKKILFILFALFTAMSAHAKKMTSDRLAMNLADRAMEYFSENKTMPLNLKALGAEFLEDDITFDVSVQKISETEIEITVLDKTLENDKKVSSGIYDIHKSKIVYEAGITNEHIFTLFCDGKKSCSYKENSDGQQYDVQIFDERFSYLDGDLKKITTKP